MDKNKPLSPHWVKHTKVIPASHPRENLTVQGPDARLHIVLDDHHITESIPDDALTLILTHGTSFSRIFWDLILSDLVSRPSLKHRLRRIITIDAVNHGDSAVCNAKTLGTHAFWPDISRDILNTLDELNVTGPIIGIGHSFGGGTLLHAALMAPSRFAATILVEPILFQMKRETEAIARLASRRRDYWETLEDVSTSFHKSFRDWHPDQLARYINSCTHYVTSNTGAGYWTLKTPKEQEAATYLAAPYPRILDLLTDSSQRHYFIFGSDSKVINAERRKRVEMISPRRDSVTVIAGAGHLVPMTHLGELCNLLERQLVEVQSHIGNSLPTSSKM